MQLALWDFPPADALEAAAQRLPFEVERRSGAVCLELAQAQQVDVALVPVIHALMAVDDLQLIPGGAVSTWAYPFIRIKLKHGLSCVSSLKVSSDYVQESFMARIILKEHYGQDVTIVPEGPADAHLLTGNASLALSDDPRALDLGQEWYEMAQYPMVWALYVCARETATPAMVDAIISLTKEAEIVAHEWGERSGSETNHFWAGSLRLRLDDVAMAGLTSIRDYLYYFGVTDELALLPLYESPEVPVSETIPGWAQESWNAP